MPKFTGLFLSTLVIALSVSSLVSADSFRRIHDVGRRRHAVNVVERDRQMHKRFDNAQFTYYNDGMNACGSFDQPGDFIVALNSDQWDGGSHCYDKITITYQGKTAQATITDECPGCPYGGLDFSEGLMNYFASTAAGEIFGAWVFGSARLPLLPAFDIGDSHSPPTPTTPTPTPTPTPTSTTTSHSSTSSKPKPTTTSTYSSTSSSTSSSSSSSTTTSSTTSAAPTPTAEVFDSGNINQFTLALVQLTGLMGAAYLDSAQ
ncbi:hypothetical protein A0H81_04503 [Grifola frondosa]|uniref:Allergen Asp f 7 n=1 Tax=Grifola frondosa TaxID=5627 RepID=A0A1C7MJJ0_GRIFR|nr:hypothetical protein A0H81_04503 [Grifola frondosa]